MKKHIGTILIILGLGIIAFPFIGRFVADQRQQAMLDEFYLEMDTNARATSDYSNLDSIFEATNTEEGQERLDASLQEIDEIALDGSNLQGDGQGNPQSSMTLGEQPDTIGIINIPRIGLRAPVAEGAGLDILRFAIGHMESTADLGEIGNAVVAGHRSHSFGVYFNRLDEMQINDEIIVETANGKITYVVYEILIVEPNDVSVLKGSSSHRVLTLVTCDPVYNPTHRLIVHAIDKSQL
jgi:sortase A